MYIGMKMRGAATGHKLFQLNISVLVREKEEREAILYPRHPIGHNKIKSIYIYIYIKLL